jgi:uncharacterized protein YbjT (DUF2867 family)
MDKILITGATGNVGSEVVRALLAQGQPVVAAAMDEEDARQVPGEATEMVHFGFGKPETYRAAFEGVSKLFLMRPPQISDVKSYLFPVVDYAKEAGVEQIVFLSLLGVERQRFVPHYKVEKHLEDSGVPHTFLRPSLYMQNLNTTHQDEIRDFSEIRIPVGRAQTSFIDVRDIGSVAAKVMSEPGHENQAYELTGSESLDYYQVAELLTEVLGREITYRNPSVLRFMGYQRRKGTPLAFVLVMAGLYTATRFGSGKRVTQDVEQLLGRQPIAMRQYIEDYADCWLPEEGSRDSDEGS